MRRNKITSVLLVLLISLIYAFLSHFYINNVFYTYIVFCSISSISVALITRSYSYAYRLFGKFLTWFIISMGYVIPIIRIVHVILSK